MFSEIVVATKIDRFMHLFKYLPSNRLFYSIAVGNTTPRFHMQYRFEALNCNSDWKPERNIRLSVHLSRFTQFIFTLAWMTQLWQSSLNSSVLGRIEQSDDTERTSSCRRRYAASCAITTRCGHIKKWCHWRSARMRHAFQDNSVNKDINSLTFGVLLAHVHRCDSRMQHCWLTQCIALQLFEWIDSGSLPSVSSPVPFFFFFFFFSFYFLLIFSLFYFLLLLSSCL